ncbi:hypothetical protein [Psychrobacter sp. KH172YL61]|uniref:hypothetical protein n=1 Tax=Psychrobacter sp. KH172YL61 TaxID=2517899 RepID=UPI001F071635|nr:hypothetical protein [Psychrobacter sp. KH172YL61]
MATSSLCETEYTNGELEQNCRLMDGLRGEWLIEPDVHPESKFYMPFVRYVKKSPRSKKKEKVDLGMRRPDFASIGQALRHLNKVCDNVSIVEED